MKSVTAGLNNRRHKQLIWVLQNELNAQLDCIQSVPFTYKNQDEEQIGLLDSSQSEIPVDMRPMLHQAIHQHNRSQWPSFERMNDFFLIRRCDNLSHQ
jgi:hypothetical protein